MAEKEKKVTEAEPKSQEVVMDPWDMLVFGPPRQPVAQQESTEQPEAKKKSK
ncbi:hypothetical protein [Alkalihalobacterium sp. APHAB7]|uniref:hypothetical protein n=1 Tax=Alkalihalobacterium sp. APHAB7 TaxID=3402081 RepID=UPI003AACAA9D